MQANSKVTLAGVDLGEKRHVCGLFNSRDEQFETLLPFFLEGFSQGEKVIEIVDPAARDEYVGRMRDAGIDVDQSQATGQVEVRGWEAGHLYGGWFDQEKMMVLVEDLLKTCKSDGYPSTRVVGHMEWATMDVPGVEDLVEYESRINSILSRYSDPVICCYDVSKFPADVILGVLRTHPMAIVGGTLHRNPFYVEPDVFLAELRFRKTATVTKQ